MEKLPNEIIYAITAFLFGADRANFRRTNIYFYSLKFLRSNLPIRIRRIKDSQLGEFSKTLSKIKEPIALRFQNLSHPQLSLSALTRKLTKITTITSISFDECNYVIKRGSVFNGLSNLLALTNLRISSRTQIKYEALTNIKTLSIYGFDTKDDERKIRQCTLKALPNLTDLEIKRNSMDTTRFLRNNTAELNLKDLINPHKITRLAIDADKWNRMKDQATLLTELKSLHIFSIACSIWPKLDVPITTLECLEFDIPTVAPISSLVKRNKRLTKFKCRIYQQFKALTSKDKIFAKDDAKKLEEIDISIPRAKYLRLLPDNMTAISIDERHPIREEYSADGTDFKRFTKLKSLSTPVFEIQLEFPRTLTELNIHQQVFNYIIPAEKLPNLEVLRHIIRRKSIEDLQRLTKLHDLTIVATMETTPYLSTLTTLTKLIIPGTLNFKEFADLAKLTNLQHLEIPRCTHDDQIQELSTLKKLTRFYCAELITAGWTLTCLTNLQFFEAHPLDVPNVGSFPRVPSIPSYVLDKLPYCLAEVEPKSWNLD